MKQHMRTLTVPDDQEGWEALALNIVRANMALAGLNNRDLQRRLRKMEIYASEEAISRRLARGTFPASFFLQVLVATGVETLELPKPAAKPEAGDD